MPKKKHELFRSKPARGLKDSFQAIDREKNTIFGASIVSVGELLGHDVNADETTVDQVVEHGNMSNRGIKARFGHPMMSANAEGRFLGRFDNFVRDGEIARADLHIANAAFSSPEGNIGTYVMDLAEEDPDAFGVSMVIDGEREHLKDEDGNLVKNDKDEVLRPNLRVKKIWASDVVDDPATGDGLFSRPDFAKTVQLSAGFTEQLDKLVDSPDAPEIAKAFLERYASDRGNKSLLIDGLKGHFDRLITGKETQEIEGFESGNNVTQSSLSEGAEMPEETKTQETVAHEKELLEARTEAAAVERKRIETVQKLGAKMSISKELRNKAITEGWTIEKTADEFSAAEVLTTAPAAEVKVVADGIEKRRDGMTKALSVNCGIENDPAVKTEVRKSEYSNLGLRSFASECLKTAGVPNVHMMSGDDLYHNVIRMQFDGSMAQGTGDFTNVLANVVNKSMGKGWNNARTTYQMWCGTGQASDFKQFRIVRLTDFSDVEEIPEGEAPKKGVMRDTYEAGRLFTIGKSYTLTRQAITNDDMNALTRIPEKFTASVRHYINRYVYVTILYGTNFAGPTLNEDSAAMFSTTRTNLAAGAGGALSQSTLDAGYDAFFNFASLSQGDDSNTRYQNVGPRYLLHAPKDYLIVDQLLRSPFYAASGVDGSNSGSQLVNPYGPGSGRQVEPISEVLLQHVDSTYDTPFYLAADASVIDTVLVYTLNGKDTPVTRSEPSAVGEAQGMKWDVTYDFAAVAGDWRGMFCNKGGA